MTDDHDTPQRPRFHGFLLYVFIMNLVAMLIVGALQLIGAARATTTVCGWLPPIYAKMTGRVPCPYSLPDPWAPVPEVVVQRPAPRAPGFELAPLLRFEPIKFGN